MDGQYHTDLRPGDLGQPRDLTDRIHAHLQDGHFVGCVEVQQRHRQPGFRVEVPLVA